MGVRSAYKIVISSFSLGASGAIGFLYFSANPDARTQPLQVLSNSIHGARVLAATAVNIPQFERQRKDINYPFGNESTESVLFNRAKWDDNWDRRDPASLVPAKIVKKGTDSDEYIEKLKEVKAKATRHIILIRHGQYVLEGQTDRERTLTNLGKEQAAETGKRLAALGFPYTILVHSTMQRATETAEIIHNYIKDVPIVSCDFIREGAPIQPEPPNASWKPSAMQFYEDGARIEAGFRKYFYRAHHDQEKDSYTVMVCHANVIRYYVMRALQLPPEAWLRMSLHNGSLTWVTIRPSGRVSVRGVGDCGHFPRSHLTTN